MYPPQTTMTRNRDTRAVMMSQHLKTSLIVVIVALAGCIGALPQSEETGTPGPDQAYPDGAGPTHINFSTLNADESNVSHSPRKHWDSYAVSYSAPSERPLIEGSYYINSSSGEILGERWNDGRVYLNGSRYAFIQPTESIPEHERKQLDADDQFIYHEATDAYYRYDRQYGHVAPTNLGRHPALLEAYEWKAIESKTHHGVPVITYKAMGTRESSRGSQTATGTLQLGVQDGVIYAFNITVTGPEGVYDYRYDVRPSPFPEHEWVDIAQEIARAQ